MGKCWRPAQRIKQGNTKAVAQEKKEKDKKKDK